MPQLNLGNGYSIDLSDGWTFVHTLQDALKQLDEAWNTHAAGLLAVPPPGRDSHSGDFASTMTQAVQAHNDWVVRQQRNLLDMVNAAKAMLHQYDIAETDNSVQWDDPSSRTPPRQGGIRAV